MPRLQEIETGVTVANAITTLRFLLVPAIVHTMLTGAWPIAFAGFVVAGVSDAVDGFVARHLNQRSRIGAWLDPLADKLLLVSVFLVLGHLRELPIWLVVAAVSRDVLIMAAVLLSTMVGRQAEMRPLAVSKVNTAVQIVLAATVLAELALPASFGPVRGMLVILSGVLTLASAIAYLLGWFKHMARSGEGA